MPFTRRTFLKNSAAGIAGLTAPCSCQHLLWLQNRKDHFNPCGIRSHGIKPRIGSGTPSSGSGPTGGRNASLVRGSWSARSMYEEGSRNYQYQCEHYGNPSKAGFKDVIHQWRAEAWDPEQSDKSV